MNEPFSCALCHANEYREAVDRDFSALSAAGYALVPLEATEEMVSAAVNGGPVKHEAGLVLRWALKRAIPELNAAIAKGNILEGDG